MLRSLKNSLKSGKKGTSSSPKEEAQAVVSSSKQQSSSSSKQPAQPAKQQGQPVKEKPPLPVINEQNVQLYYADPLPSFRKYIVMRQGLQCLEEPCMQALMSQNRSLASWTSVCTVTHIFWYQVIAVDWLVQLCGTGCGPWACRNPYHWRRTAAVGVALFAGDVPPSEKQLLFVQKLHLCSFTFDFTDPTKHVREKEIKRQTLLELVDYANSGQGKFTEAVSEDIIFMLSQNLFRTLPPSRSHDVDNFDPEEEEPTLEPAWPHLQVTDNSIGAT